ncbi:MAG: DUF3047 domain-containing protein [Gammaproteobacteria bacterium]|nr:DUF3047 domain-containing protein [Gammaproteobacteria bacterium]
MKMGTNRAYNSIKFTPLILPVGALLSLFGYTYAQQNQVSIDLNQLSWAERQFRGNTDYRFVEEDKQLIIASEANGTASALYQEIDLDLNEFPILHWSWQVDMSEFSTPTNTDETSRAGDDFAARIYVVRRGGLKFWKTRAINYVWSRSLAIDQRWNNPYSNGNQVMWAVSSGESDVWVSNSRNIREDWKVAFNEDISSLDGLALMTDADNTGLVARAKFKNIYFEDR